ncbi:hemolysin family protein [Candidatus Methylobacter oryzae]|uniref:HlyC/CorC family transporter n=1 Tax=Candidatus Methylobacter oryzae TaxID=2497749 RepID=A0ABY3C6U0_9GAMM|nr:hemolysin family protein [Candidatus Methylobacter oryzae]TRW90838.1 HlyC/CorC family transporter [Candidatus Methylobacter oryzae]
MSNFFPIIAALLLVALNGFFVAAEFGLVKLRQTRIRSIAKTQGWRGRVLGRVHAKLDAYLSACQLGITLASLGLGWIGEPAFADLLEPVFAGLNVTSPEMVHGVSFTFAFSLISFLHIVIGELAPKSLAIRNPEKISLWGAVPLYGFYWLMYPAIWLLNSSANLVLRLLGLRHVHDHDTHYSPNELKLILRSNSPEGRFTRDEWNILAKTLDFSELEVSDLMRPIHEMTALHRNASLQTNLQTISQKRFSRYPYFDSNDIDVLGVIHLKDLFLAQQEGKTIEDLSHYLRPVKYTLPHKPALELFRQFRMGTSHFAIIGQKGQKPKGFITLDNLLSAMVGEIRDEFRPNNNDWTRLDDGTLIGKGSLPIFSLERIMGIDIENEELDLEDEVSIGGLIMAKLRDIPVEGQKIEFNQFDVVVRKMNESRIVYVQVYPNEVNDSGDE